MSVKIEHLTHYYNACTPFESLALNQVSATIQEESFTAIIGHTGSGKSTLIKHLNGLCLPDEGVIDIEGIQIGAGDKKKSFVDLRKKVGLVFQFPEAQLFEETVLKDVMFGPLNFGYSKKEAEALASEALQMTGISEELYSRNPQELSGGQMRRVALAGVLAIKPKVLVLDEPTAGLDPEGHQAMMTLFKKYQQQGMTIIMVTHQMEDVAEYCDEVIVMEKGKVLKQAVPYDLFQEIEWLEQHHLTSPSVTQFAFRLRQKGILKMETLPITVDDFLKLWRMNHE